MKNDIKALVSIALFLMLVLNSVVFLDLRPAFQGQAPTATSYAPWQAAGQGEEKPVGIAQFMFGPFALPLVVLSTALLVALVGALVLAKPDDADRSAFRPSARSPGMETPSVFTREGDDL